jgi:DNA-binding response OmpR family regulator
MAWNVLLVEADPALADEIRQAFGPAGFQVSVLTTGEAAVERGRVAAPHLILLSAELPDMSGFSVCNRLKRAWAGTPLLLYTREAIDSAIEAHRASRGRADAYLRCPLDMAELMAQAATLLQAEPGGAPAPAPPHRPSAASPAGAAPPPSASTTCSPSGRATRRRPRGRPTRSWSTSGTGCAPATAS